MAQVTHLQPTPPYPQSLPPQAPQNPLPDHPETTQLFLSEPRPSDTDQQPPMPIPEPEIDYRLPEFVDYFNKKKNSIKNQHQGTATNLVQACQDSINEQISHGMTLIPNLSKSLSEYLQASNEKEPDDCKDLKKSRKLDLSPPPDHQQFIERMTAIRKLNENKRKQYLEYQQRKKQQMLKKQQEERLKSQEKKKEEKQKQIKEKLEQLERRKQKSIEEQKESIRRYKSVISEKRRHELMAEKYENNVLRPLVEEQRKKLEQRSQRIKGYSIDEIREFQKEYAKKQQERQQLQQKKDDWSYVPPPIRPRLYQILEEEKIRERVKLQQKKRALEQKIARQSDYVQYLKESITIKIDQKKKKQLQQLTAVKPIIKKSEEELRNIGNSYLKEVRSKVKRDSKKDNYSLQQESRKSDSHSGEKVKSNTSMGNYEYSINQIRQNRINRLISATTIDKSEKLGKLRLEVDRLAEEAKRKEEISKVSAKRRDSDSHMEVLINSIKAKVEIMNLYRD